MRLIAENDAMQWPGFWWCACGSMSSPAMFGGLRSLGVCVELLVTVVTSSPFVPSFATGDLKKPEKRENNRRNQNEPAHHKSHNYSLIHNNRTVCRRQDGMNE